MQLDSLQIGVHDLAAAGQAYETLLGMPPQRRSESLRFQLDRGAVELFGDPTATRELRFLGEAGHAPRVETVHGVKVRIDPATSMATPEAAGLAIDHVVIRTTVPERAIRSWRDERGLRLAFDKEFPQRGLRLLFFRSHGITLEYAAPFPAVDTPPEDDAIYGISYRVQDLAAVRVRLLAAQVDVSDIRRGHREATSVCTVRSGTCGIPTLLLQRDEAG